MVALEHRARPLVAEALQQAGRVDDVGEEDGRDRRGHAASSFATCSARTRPEMRMREHGEAFPLRQKSDAAGADDGERALGGLRSVHPLPGDLVGPRQIAQRADPERWVPARFRHLDCLPRLPEGGTAVAQQLGHDRRHAVGEGPCLRVPAPPRDLDRPLDHLGAIHGAPEPGHREAALGQINAVRAEPGDLGAEVRLASAQGLRLRRNPDRLLEATSDPKVYAVGTSRQEAEEGVSQAVGQGDGFAQMREAFLHLLCLR
jgi:hypothetical protein